MTTSSTASAAPALMLLARMTMRVCLTPSLLLLLAAAGSSAPAAPGGWLALTPALASMPAAGGAVPAVWVLLAARDVPVPVAGVSSTWLIVKKEPDRACRRMKASCGSAVLQLCQVQSLRRGAVDSCRMCCWRWWRRLQYGMHGC